MATPDTSDHLSIAIIGMTGRFPGAQDLETFWQNLQAGVESISFLSDEEVAASIPDPKLLSDPNYVKAAAILEDTDLFDAAFFGFTPREAEIMDPQHRLFLECAWEALEHAGYAPGTSRATVGLFAGSRLNSYLLFNLFPRPDFIEYMGGLQAIIGSDKDFLTTRVSYKLDLKGPSVTVQTACSTSLVAVHLACQSLLNGECDMALAGGVSINVPQKSGYLYQEGGISSPDGHNRAFDARAQGSVTGNGLGIVVLKRLTDALADGDTIHAVIRGSAINNDGAAKVGYTAPAIDGQARVVAEAHAVAGIDPATITYVEAHGTATPLGDPIEVAALAQAFRARTSQTGFCALGSVKTNIGHLDAAAGIAGLIKTVLALTHQQLPPSLHYTQPHPAIDFAHSPFYVVTQLQPWQAVDGVRRAGVSSFGIGGTNAHVVLEAAPERERCEPGRDWQLLVLAARTAGALEAATDRLAAELRRSPTLKLADVAYTLQVGRRGFGQRRVLVARGRDDALAALETRDPARIMTSAAEVIGRPVAFMFPGLGDHYVGMGLELYRTEPVFQEHVDRCAEVLTRHLGLDLRDVLYPDRDAVVPPHQRRRLDKAAPDLNLRAMLKAAEQPADPATQQLNTTALVQPALFVVEYALAQLLIAWGIRPQALIGHSLGEYVAACLAGVFSLEDALFLVAQRAAMIQELPGGAMLAVPLPEEEVRVLLRSRLSLAAVNSPSLCVVAGETDAIAELERELRERAVASRRLETRHAFHSKMMESIRAAFADLVRSIGPHPPTIPYLSNVTGTWITPEEATDPDYWGTHLCQTVRFADGIRQLCQDHERILLEVGPGQSLSALALQHSDMAADRVVLPCIRHVYDQRSDVAFLLNTIGQLWLGGVAIDWHALYAHEQRRRVPLPTYPFERQRYWIDPPDRLSGALAPARIPDGKQPLAQWFSVPIWKQTMPVKSIMSGDSADQQRNWLVFADECGVGACLAERLERAGQHVVVVRAGTRFVQLAAQQYLLDPRSPRDYDALIGELRAASNVPEQIVHCWSVTPAAPQLTGPAYFEERQHTGFYSLLFLAQALGKQLVTGPVQLWVIADHLHKVESGDTILPEKASVLGLCKVIPQEYMNITCRSIDVIPAPGGAREQHLIDQLMAELHARVPETVVAYRGRQRWMQTFDAVTLDAVPGRPLRVREQGIYLITGGLGTIGLTLAEYLARVARTKLVLTGRSAFPPRDTWETWLATHDEQDHVSAQIKKLQYIEQLGADILVIEADVADEAQMRAAIAHACARFGRIHGLIHAAGIVAAESFTTISETGYSQCERHFHGKVRGLYTLEKVLQDQKLDFYLLISSLSTVLGGLGFGASAAANVFMDAFAHDRNDRADPVWFSVDWDGAADPEETVEAFGRMLSMEPVAQVVVCTNDLTANIAKWITFEAARGAPDTSGALPAYARHARPNVRTSYVPPSNETEAIIAAIWQELLGIEPIGIHDDFFQLGGDSLLGTQLMARLRQVFRADLPLRALFEATTVAGLALVIEDILIDEIEQMAEAELVDPST